MRKNVLCILGIIVALGCIVALLWLIGNGYVQKWFG